MCAKLRAARARITFFLIIIVVLFPLRLFLLSVTITKNLGPVAFVRPIRSGESYVVPSDVELIVREAAGTG